MRVQFGVLASRCATALVANPTVNVARADVE
jgi:hypothetical protein